MKRCVVDVLGGGFQTPNGRGFLTPLYRARKALERVGVTLRFRPNLDQMKGGECALVGSKFHATRWSRELDQVVAELRGLKSRYDQLVWFNCADSATTLIPPALEIVDRYLKSFLLKERTHYCEPLGANRFHLDWYMRRGLIPEAPMDPFFVVPDQRHLSKLGVGWNPGLAYYGPAWNGTQALEARVGRPVFYDRGWLAAPVSALRVGVSLRMGLDHHVRAVGQYRRLFLDQVASQLEHRKVGHVRYQRELATMRVGLSPFGLGEVSLRDFEILRAGMVLVKPDMSHVETFPDFYVPRESYVALRWDMQDSKDKVAWSLESDEALEIARRGQSNYLFWVTTEEALERFAEHFLSAVLGRGGD